MKHSESACILHASGNHIKLTDFTDFISYAGNCEKVWISPVIKTDTPFNDMIVSWNTGTPPGTWAEIFARVWLPEYDGWTAPDGRTFSGWSDWITWGRWSPHIARNCTYQQDSHPRKDSSEDNGWVFSNALFSDGDSSLNVRGSLTASALQLKAVLHAEEECCQQPSLRLLAATWKNTLDSAWQSKCSYPEAPADPAKSVLLNTPAISQMARDPDYGNVICSATCIAMLLNGRGEDVLPEDVTLMNYDYGFGGNGNWSYSCAAAGEYGYESYVSYSDFPAIRQELTKGYAVALSVKYSDKTGDTVPYLAHCPCRAPGHLITIVGYYFSDALGEYVYLSNDPAAKSDGETAHREYRQSELDKCWYRRAAYFVHDRYAGAECSARRYVKAELRPAAEHPDPWVLTTDGKPVLLPADFMKNRREEYGSHGTICYYVDDEPTALPENCRRISANHIFHYDGFTITPEGWITFQKDTLTQLLKEGRKVTLYVISNSGTMWTADCRL